MSSNSYTIIVVYAAVISFCFVDAATVRLPQGGINYRMQRSMSPPSTRDDAIAITIGSHRTVDLSAPAANNETFTGAVVARAFVASVSVVTPNPSCDETSAAMRRLTHIEQWSSYDLSQYKTTWTVLFTFLEKAALRRTPTDHAIVCVAFGNRMGYDASKFYPIRRRADLFGAASATYYFPILPGSGPIFYTVEPTTPLAGRWVRLALSGVASGTPLAVVFTATAESCDAPVMPSSRIVGTNITALATDHRISVVFPQQAPRVYVCVARMVAGRPTTWVGVGGGFFTVSPVAAIARDDLWRYSCAPLIAGVDTTCSVSTAWGNVSLHSEDFGISAMTDGDGQTFCPRSHVAVQQGATEYEVKFRFQYQHGGRGATIQLTHRRRPIPFYHQRIDSTFLVLPHNHTHSLAQGSRSRHEQNYFDFTKIHLVVQPPPTDLMRRAAPQREKDALIRMFIATGGSAWRSSRGWGTTPTLDPCLGNWQGVACHLGHVVELRLPHNNLVGFIDAADLFASLPRLRVLDVRRNHLKGFGGNREADNITAVYLGTLDVSENTVLASLPRLRGTYCLNTLRASHNQLTAQSLEYSDALVSDSDQIRFVDVSHNRIDMLVRDLLLRFLTSHRTNGTHAATRGLEVLRASDNLLVGQLPREVPGLAAYRQLKELDLSHNHLNSTLPDTFFTSWCSLHTLNLGSNNLYGDLLPAAGFCGSFYRVLSLDLSHNQLSFVVAPRALLEAVRRVHFEGNHFLCPLPFDGESTKSETWVAKLLPQRENYACDASRG
eukprot:PhM_4_TR7113/c0_g1_i1/m.6735